MSISVTIDGNHPTFSSLDASIRTRWSNHLRSPCQDASYAITSSRPVGRHTYAVFRCVYGVIGVISGAKLSRGAPDVGIIRTRWSSHLRSPCQEASYSMNEVGSQRHLVLVYGLIGVIYGGTLSGELEDYSDNFISADAF